MARKRTLSGLLCAVFALVSLACDNDLDTARALQDEGRFEESLELLRPMVAANPNHSETLYLYGAALVLTGQHSASLWSLDKASQDPEFTHDAGLLLAFTAAKGKHWVTAIEAANRVLAIDPDDTGALLLRAEARLEDKRDAEAALADFERVIELKPDHLDALVSKASTLLHLKRHEEASEIIRSLEERSSELRASEASHFCVVSATYAHESGDIESAEEQLLGCVERYPESQLPLTRLMSFYDTTDRRETTDQILRERIERHPNTPGFRITLAMRARVRGDVEEAERLLREGTTHPNPRVAGDSWSALADHYRAVGDLSAAVEAADEVFRRVQSPSPSALFSYADLLGMAGENDRALAVAEQIDNEALRNLVAARVLLNQRQPEAALAKFDEALKLWPDMPQARYYAGVTAERLGRLERALEEYRQAIRIGPEHSESGLRLARIYLGMERPESAQIAIDHHIRAHEGDLRATRVGLRIAAELDREDLRKGLIAAYAGNPRGLPFVYEMLADLTSDSAGAAAAVELLTEKERFDFASLTNLPALRAWVRHALAAGSDGPARAALAAMMAAHPNVAGLLEIHATVLEHDGGQTPELEETLRRAVELNPANARALRRLARIVAERGETDTALSLFQRALAAEIADPSLEPTSWRGIADLLVAASRQPEAERRLDDLLWDQPHLGDAALLLAQLRESRDAPERKRTYQLARRAFQLGAGDPARALMDRLEGAAGPEGS